MGGSIRNCLLVFTAAIVAIALLAGGEATAKPKTTTMQIPKGATVKQQTQSQMIMNNNGATGTFDCRCTGVNHNGTCQLGRGSSTIICGTEGSTCQGTCKLYTTTNGLSGGLKMMRK